MCRGEPGNEVTYHVRIKTGTRTFQGKTLPDLGAALHTKLSAPSSSERRQLVYVFPSSRAGCSYKRVFDPTAE